jgi:peptide/nickel transport system permease protein|tara:strand:- start:3366 stop:4295 length:930 start_codon:yes stop_codon:yes gene_type:complete
MVRLVATLLFVTFVTFMATSLLPGDPVNALIPIEAQQDREFVEQLREEWGFNDPLPVRYGRWLGDAVRGDLGNSYVTGRPIIDEITPRLPVTGELMVVTVLLGILIGVPLGLLSGYREGSRADKAVSAFAQIGLSIPNFVLGLMLIYVFAIRLRWLPATGWTRISDSVTGNLKTVAMPAIALAVAEVAVYLRVLRSDIIITLKENYILSARAKGLTDRFILFRHALRPSSLTLTTLIGLNIAGLITGTIVVEQLFAIPGLGRRLFSAVFQRDYMMVQGLTVLLAAAYVIINATVDFVYMAIDPRIRRRA